ncbi:MAG: 2-oxoglutarate dehydrogenase E1 component [Polyangiales bacterium]
MSQEFGINEGFVEELQLRWNENPGSVSERWRRVFEGREEGPARPANGHANGHGAASSLSPDQAAQQSLAQAAQRMIHAYRSRGHLGAQLDPLGIALPVRAGLELADFDLREQDLDAVVPTGNLAGPSELTIRELFARLDETYCRAIGVEFMHIDEADQRLWLSARMEPTLNRLSLSSEEQRRILSKLLDAEIFETFLHTNFLGKKRFSLEGGESLIPLLDLMIDRCGDHGVKEMVLGMAHRGRLNVLCNILKKSPHDIFAHFEDKHPEKNVGRGDVKYHLGYSWDQVTRSGNSIHLSLAFNPSHLEFVNPVVEGRVRAKQDRRDDVERRQVVPLLIHGDAAFIGQGVVAETLNLMSLEGYATGGTVHVVVNNQVGFTTSPVDSRSTRYATDLAKMLGAPIFHVNGEDPEAVAQVARLAVDFRHEFRRDVVVDMYCYRKWGHNEGDEPRYTQPVMYAAIDKKPSVRAAYVSKLVALGQVTQGQVDELAAARKAVLERALSETRDRKLEPSSSALAGLWSKYQGGAGVDELPDDPTAVPEGELRGLLDAITTPPEGFSPHPKLGAILRTRRAPLTGGLVDWGCAEALAYATLLREGTSIRLSGQDARRGTFSHRHAYWTDVVTGERYTPFASQCAGKARFDVFDSALSETGVLGFDYGYSLDYPDGLVMWEGQFGDFANGAQVIIDQFIASSEDKWARLSGIVLLLPHGFEGAGPEHSSARLERFLQLAAEDNIVVVNLTTPAQLFHALRRQVLRPVRKPLVIMTPKSGLRIRPPDIAASTLDDLATGKYERVIADPTVDPAKVRKVLLCSGKIYWDLRDERKRLGADDTAIVRLEQLYPLSKRALEEALAPYRDGTPLVWVQEDPFNMGGWYFLSARLPGLLGGRMPLSCVCRDESASPATGSEKAHALEHQQLMAQAFA